jgi:competence protein ComEC
LTLIGTGLLGLSQGLGSALLTLAHGLLMLLWPFLEWLADLRWAEWRQATPPLWATLLATLGALILLAPRGLPGRWVGLVLALPLVLYTPPRPPVGGLHFTLLDVGQGMAVVVRTHGHTLVYDTGPRYPSGFDIGDLVVVPFLRHLGVERLDRLVLSHSDIDHMGGASAVLEAFPHTPVLSGEPERVPGTAAPCMAGQGWHWDGVAFEILHPSGSGLVDNDASCVLRIEVAGTVILLPGDIEGRVERELAKTWGTRLRAHVLVAPHHGSRSSSSAELIAAVRPDLVLFPAGYRNRYHFPAGSVVRRYQLAGARLLDTPTHGAITLWIDPGGTRHAPQPHRVASRHYWTVR